MWRCFWVAGGAAISAVFIVASVDRLVGTGAGASMGRHGNLDQEPCG